MHRSGTCYSLEAPMPERVRLWQEDFGHFRTDPESLLRCLQHLIPLVGREEFDAWRSLGQAGRVDELFERLMVKHYDPAYARTHAKHFGNVEMRPVVLPDLNSATLEELARQLAEDASVEAAR
jgi:tRNA 2-selenouridine synthase